MFSLSKIHAVDFRQGFLQAPATNATVTWSTEFHGLAVTALRRAARPIDDELLSHIWPSHHANINFYVTHSVDVDGELAKLDTDGYRPLRLPRAARG